MKICKLLNIYKYLTKRYFTWSDCSDLSCSVIVVLPQMIVLIPVG